MRRSPSLLTICLATLGVLSVETPAFADPTDGARADALFQEGKKLVNDGNLPEGRAKYAEAYALKPSADIACNLGSTELDLKDYAPAATHLEVCLRIFPATGAADKRAIAEKRFAQAKAEVAVLHVTVNKEGAAVLLDDAKIGQSPLPDSVFATPGHHVITAQLEGMAGTPKAVDVARGQESNVALTLATNGGGEAGTGRTIVPAAVGFGLTGALLITGIGTLVAADTKSLKGCATPLACKDIQDSKNTLSNASLWTFVGAGAFAAASTGLLIWSLGGKSAKTTSARVEILPGIGGGSLRIDY